MARASAGEGKRDGSGGDGGGGSGLFVYHCHLLHPHPRPLPPPSPACLSSLEGRAERRMIKKMEATQSSRQRRPFIYSKTITLASTCTLLQTANLGSRPCLLGQEAARRWWCNKLLHNTFSSPSTPSSPCWCFCARKEQVQCESKCRLLKPSITNRRSTAVSIVLSSDFYTKVAS